MAYSEQRLAGKVVVVTGAESGIGRAIALRCAAEGASVAVSGLVADGLAETATLSQGKTSMLTQVADIRDPDQIRELMEQTVARFGRLDAAVANAGGGSPGCPLIDIKLEDWTNTIALNLTGTFITLQAAARVLVAQGEGGSLLATGSSTAIRPMPGLLPYASSKGGLHHMMRCLAVELAEHRIRVNTIVPGGTATAPVLGIADYAERNFPTVPMKELVQPDEIGAIVAFALSDNTPHMTGTLLKVDAGRTSI